MLAASGAAGGDPWLEVRGPHFVVLSDAGTSEARRVARQFERIRAAIRIVWPWARVDADTPLRIVAVRNEDGLKTLLPQFWEKEGSVRPVGVFVRGRERPYVVLRTNVGFSLGENPYHSIYHEYVHFVLDLNFASLPLWLNEGLAEFFGATVVSVNGVEVGRLIPSHQLLLQQKGRKPVAELFQVDRASPDYNQESRSSVFYAESWALVHYLMLDEKARSEGRLPALLKSLAEGAAEAEATRSVFGDSRDLDRDLGKYLERRTFNLGLQRPVSVNDQDLGLRELAPAEACALRGDVHLQTDRPAEARAALEEALGLDAKLAAAHEGMGVLDFSQGRYADAQRRLAQAIQLDSQSAFAHYLHAVAILREGTTTQALVAARSSLERAIELNGGLAAAHASLAEVMSFGDDDLDKALASARRAVSLEPAVIDHRLTVGRVLLHRGKLDDAQHEGERALTRCRTPEDRRLVQTFLAEVQNPPRFLPKDPAGLAAILERRCGGGQARDCTELGQRRRQGDGVSKDEAQAFLFLGKGCDGGDAEGCAHLGWAYEFGEAVAKDEPRAADLYKKSCDADVAWSCVRLGWLHQQGHGVSRDQAHAAGLYQRACRGGFAHGCTSLALLQLAGPAPRGAAQAAALLKQACDGDDPQGCGVLASLLETGSIVPRDAARSRALHKKACDGGYAPSCERLKAFGR